MFSATRRYGRSGSPTMLQLSFVGGLTGQYVDFSTAQRAALRMTAARARKDLSTAAIETVVDAMRRLPAHPEVPQALTRLADAGYRVTALTNSVLDVARAQLSNAGLIERFEASLLRRRGAGAQASPRALSDGRRPVRGGHRRRCAWSRRTPGMSPGLWPPAHRRRSSPGAGSRPVRWGLSPA